MNKLLPIYLMIPLVTIPAHANDLSQQATAVANLATPITKEKNDLSVNEPVPVMLRITNIKGLSGYDASLMTNCYSFAAVTENTKTTRLEFTILHLSCQNKDSKNRIMANIRGTVFDDKGKPGIPFIPSSPTGDTFPALLNIGQTMQVTYSYTGKVNWKPE
jgi:hypothetical protein